MVNGNTAFIIQRETIYCHVVTIFIVNPCLSIDENYPLPLGQSGRRKNLLMKTPKHTNTKLGIYYNREIF